MGIENPSAEDYMSQLRSNLHEPPTFKQKLIGGVDEEDVIKFIDTIEQKYQLEIKQITREREALVKQLSALENKVNNQKADALEVENEKDLFSSKIADLEKQIFSSRNELDERIRVCQELEQQLELEKSRNAAMDKDTEGLKQRIVSLEETLKESQMEVEEHRKLREQSEKESNIETLQFEGFKFNEFKDGIGAIYKQLDNLTEQIEINHKLQQQLNLENSRAIKAEKDFSQFIEWVSELKENLQNDHGQLEGQLREIEEKHQLFLLEINELVIGLHNFGINTRTKLEELCVGVDKTHAINDNMKSDGLDNDNADTLNE